MRRWVQRDAGQNCVPRCSIKYSFDRHGFAGDKHAAHKQAECIGTTPADRFQAAGSLPITRCKLWCVKSPKINEKARVQEIHVMSSYCVVGVFVCPFTYLRSQANRFSLGRNLTKTVHRKSLKKGKSPYICFWFLFIGDLKRCGKCFKHT